MELEGALLWVNVAIVLLDIVAWRWARSVEHNLRGQEGYGLAAVITTLIGGFTIARLIGSLAFVVRGVSPDDVTSVLGVTIVSQLVLLGVIIWAIVRVRRLASSDDPG